MPTQKEVWILEWGTPGLAEFRYALQSRYRLRYLTGLSELESALSQEAPTLLIADLHFGDQTLLGFIAQMDASRIPPFIVLSDMDDGDVLRSCFDRGAVDFLRKPFTKGELLARVERAIAPCLGGITVSATSMRARLGVHRSSVLTAKEFQILNLLISASHQRLSRQSIVSGVWSETRVVPKTFDVHLSKLRRKLATIGVRIIYHPPGDYSLGLETVGEAAGSSERIATNPQPAVACL